MPAGSDIPQEGEQVMLSFNRESLHLMEEGA
jgi:hypothetical protein